MKKHVCTLCTLMGLVPILFLSHQIKAEHVVIRSKKPLNIVNDKREINIERKRDVTKKLVDDAVPFLQKNEVGPVCDAFERDPRWRKGDLFVFMFDENGTCYVHGDDSSVIWHEFGQTKDMSGASFIKDMLKIGEKGGWISYDWNYDLKESYVRVVKKESRTKDGKKLYRRYIVGSGFYPSAAEFETEQLVEKAARYFEAYGPKETFQQINNPRGPFTMGEVYLWAYDLTGMAFAHGKNLAVVGQNRLDWQDSDGKYRNRTMIKKAQKEGEGWIEYSEKGVPKRAYFKMIIDPQTAKQYLIGGGFYPGIDDDKVKTFVKRAIHYIKAQGASVALRDFSSHAGGFVKGPLSIFVYDMEGKMLADSENPIFIGQNLINTKDREGKFTTRDIIGTAQKYGKGWITLLDNNAYKSIYVEKVRTPDGEFVVGSGYWPASKRHTIESLVEKATLHMKSHTAPESFRAFCTHSSEFLRGDIHISVLDKNGIRLVAGTNKYLIWENDRGYLDKKGKSVADHLISTAMAGGGWVSYDIEYGTFRAYTKQVSKITDGHEEVFTIFSGYFA